MQLGRYVRNGLIHAEELCAFPSLPCSLPLLPAFSLLLARIVLHGVTKQWRATGLSSLLPHEELEGEAKCKD